jgi:hypothetical protein
MPVLPSFLIGLALGLVLAGVGGFYLWRVWRPRREVFEGRRILAGMRWRELSNLVMDALASAGFEPESAESRVARGANADLLLHRDGRPWLVVCKQGLDHRVSPQAVEEVQRAVRLQQAAGAVVVTPGHVDPKAREVSSSIELADGTDLWRLLDPLLPASVHDEVGSRARAQAMRHSAVVIGAAAVITFGVTWALTRFSAGEEPAPRIAAATTPRERPPQPVQAAPSRQESSLGEAEQRRELAQRLSELPGVDRALWSTASTLQVFVDEPVLASDDAICEVVNVYPLVRASRLQLQPPPGADRPVRFKQCSVY